jgi:hypothetical protein
MRKVFFLIACFNIVFLLGGCDALNHSIYKKQEGIAFKSREYYRTHLSKGFIGIAIANELEEHKQMKKKVLSHSYVRDAVILRDKDKVMIAVKPEPFARVHKHEITRQLKSIMKKDGNIACEVFVQPEKYRLAKKIQLTRKSQSNYNQTMLRKLLEEKKEP